MPSEPRTDWESAVYDALSEQGDMTWSDAQAMIEARELQVMTCWRLPGQTG